MEPNEGTTYSPLNAQSILSLVFGILTILFFCLSWTPIPFAGLICFPISLLFGILALIFGMISLNQIRRRNETGVPMAWIGISAGGFILMCMICLVIAIAAFFIFAPDQVQPFLDKYQI